MTTFNTGNPVPSTDGRDLSDNAETIDELVDSSLFSTTTRTGKNVLTRKGLEAQYVFTAINNGVWAAGQTFTAVNQFMVFSGTAYKPKNSTTLPYVVGATPVGDGNVEVVANLSTAQGDTRYHREFPDLASIVAAIDIADGQAVRFKERSTSNGGGTIVDIVLASSVTPDTFSVIQCVGAPTLAAVLRPIPAMSVSMFGDDSLTAVRAAAVAFILANDVTLQAGNNVIRHGRATNMLIQSAEDGQPNRVHQEPRNNIASGTVVKWDWMFDPFETDPNNYRIASVFNKIGDLNGTGEGAIAVLNGKSVGAAFGNWPSWHFGFSDDSVNGVAAKLMFFDTSDDQFRTPMKGMWHVGKSITSGDYITASNKIYFAATTGVTGATLPSHSSGTVSDGGVDWTFDKTPDGNSVRPVWMICDRDDMPMFGLSLDNRGQFLKPIAIGREGVIDFHGDSDLLHTRFRPLTGGSGERITDWVTQDGNGLLRMDATTKQLKTTGLARVVTAVVQNATDSPSAAETELVRFGNTSAQDIVRFLGGVADQVFMVDTTTAGSGFTTIKGNVSAIKTKGNVDIVLTEFQVVHFKMNFDGTRAIQIQS
jgi:hypothetical protein